MTEKGTRSYVYTRLVDLSPGVNNVFGVVKFRKLPTISAGTDYNQVISITDESLPAGEKVGITIFCKKKEDFPAVDVGDVIRFHRIRVGEFNGKKNAQSGPGFSWVYVSRHDDKPVASSSDFSYPQSAKDRMCELQRWAQGLDWLEEGSGVRTLSSLVPRQYCDLLCQVVALHTTQDPRCFAARVWDGTRCNYPDAVAGEDLDSVDSAVEEIAGDLAVDVFIYDDHVRTCQAIKPGDFIKLCNLHAAVQKTGPDVSPSLPPTLELTLHHGSAFGRGVIILPPNDPQLIAVRKRMDESIAAQRRRSQPDSTSNDWSGERHHSDNNASCSARPSAADDGAVEIGRSQRGREGLGANPVECSQAGTSSCESSLPDNELAKIMSSGSSGGINMLQTASVTVGHLQLSHTPIKQVLHHSVPCKFRVFAHLVDFHPSSFSPAQFFPQFCSKCNYLKEPDTSSSEDSGPGCVSTSSTAPDLTSGLAGMAGGGFFNFDPLTLQPPSSPGPCPLCSQDGEEVSLEWIYMIRLILQDASGPHYLVANLWRDNAVTFFGGQEPARMMREPDTFKTLMLKLLALRHDPLTSARRPSPPKLDCCLYSYNTLSGGVQYHMFDTTLL